MPKPTVQLTIRLTPQMAEQLEELAREKRKSMTATVAEILESYLAGTRKATKRSQA
ncbi:MAG: ribbon-helix-helix protein, CopG family [bacterium]|nr:ribbon-helix-helix protein, CopG family [bacterium]